MTAREMKFGLSDVSQILKIPVWQLSNFSSPKYPYKIKPSVRVGKGKGKPSLYSLTDVYEIVLLRHLLVTGLNSQIAARVVHKLFPNQASAEKLCIAERPHTWDKVRLLAIQFASAPWVEKGILPEDWRGEEEPFQEWLGLVSRQQLTGAYPANVILRGFHWMLVVPFDELFADVDSRILGRKFGFHFPPVDEAIGDKPEFNGGRK